MKPSHSSEHAIRFPVDELETRVSQLSYEPHQLVVHWADGHASRYNRFWLRDNCPTAGDKLTAIRHFYLRDMGQTTQIKQAAVNSRGDIEVHWQNDEQISVFSAIWLRQHCYEVSSCENRKRKPVLWTESINENIPTVSFTELELESENHLQLLEYLVDYGMVRVVDLPVDIEGIELLEAPLAPFTSNDFGRIFDLISEPDVWDLSQSTEALDPHSDDPYRYHPPGIRILYCVEASQEQGGRSEITNALAAAEYMRSTDPDGFECLVRTPISYVRYREDAVPQGEDVHYRTKAPVIRVDASGDVSGVRFHERSMGTFDIPPEHVDDYYQALIAFSKIVNSGKFSLKYLLKPGEAIVFDNQQVLHGRTSFTGKPGRRHLRLCQMARDQVHSRYRLLVSRLGKLGANYELSEGV